MPISQDEVKYVARLARLGLSQPELEHFQSQLEVILDYIDKLKTLDVSTIQPTAHVLEIKNIFRPDQVRPSLDPQKILNISPQREGNFFCVPKVIE